ncbi:MAG: lysozyme family protein [Candidatus Dormibacteria bacterium]
MHLPKRARGLVLGLLMLVAGPATAVLITTPTQGAAASASLVRSSVGEIDRLTNVTTHPVMLRVRSAMLFKVAVPVAVARPAAPRRARVSRPGFVVPRGLSVSQAQVVADITAAAEHWGVSVSWMLKTANCESHFHWNSVNPRGPYIGVFQFLMSTFIANGGTAATIWDPAAQANIAAKMFAHGQSHEWSCA